MPIRSRSIMPQNKCIILCIILPLHSSEGSISEICTSPLILFIPYHHYIIFNQQLVVFLTRLTLQSLHRTPPKHSRHPMNFLQMVQGGHSLRSSQLWSRWSHTDTDHCSPHMMGGVLSQWLNEQEYGNKDLGLVLWLDSLIIDSSFTGGASVFLFVCFRV